MNFVKEQKKVFAQAGKTEAQALKELESLYNKARKDLVNAVKAEQAQGTDDAARRAARFQSLIDEIDQEIINLQKESTKIVVSSIKETYRKSYNRLAYAYDGYLNTTTKFMTPGETVYTNFTFLDARAVQEALFGTAGKTISPVQFADIARNQREALRQGIRNIIANIVATGGDLKKGSEVLQALFVLLGDSVDKAKNRAKTTVRTEVLRAYSKAQIDADNEALARGVELAYRWETAKDERVRSSHRPMQGQKAQLNAAGEPFFQYPDGTRTPAPRILGSAANVINCRCQRVSYPQDFEPNSLCYRDTSGTWKQDVPNLEYRTWLSEWKKRVS